MAEHDTNQAELLEEYWMVLRREPSAAPSTELDPDIAEIARRLEENLRPPEPDHAFTTRLRDRIESRARAGSRQNGRAPAPRPARSWRWLTGFAAAAVVLFAVAGAALLVSRPAPVSAQEIIQKARATATNLGAAGIHGFAMTEVLDANGETHSELNVWYEAPNKWRYENFSVGASVQTPASPSRVTVADGQSIWNYDSSAHRVRIQAGTLGGLGHGGVALDGAGDLNAVLEESRACFDPRVTGEQTVAGRQAYVVSLGATTCPSADIPIANGPRTIWIDRETYFILKSVLLDSKTGQPVQSQEVTKIQYNPDLAASLFTFTPPAGATVEDNRGKPAPTASESPLPTPPSRPTPTAIPMPNQKILRPSWLPEKLTVHQEVQANGASQAPSVVLTFDPRPNDQPHEVLTLTERPAATDSNGETKDSQATQETVGNHDVTMIRRGKGCVTASWTQDGLALTLTNPYDPPGAPGQVRYSCDQFEKIIASVK